MTALSQINPRIRRAILVIAVPALLLTANSGHAQIRLEQVDPGVLIKPQQVESNNAGGVLLEQVDPDLRKVQPRAAAPKVTTNKPAQNKDIEQENQAAQKETIAQPQQMPFVVKGINMVFANDTSRPTLPVVSRKIELN